MQVLDFLPKILKILKWPKNEFLLRNLKFRHHFLISIGVQNGYKCHLRFNIQPLEVCFSGTTIWAKMAIFAQIGVPEKHTSRG